MKLRDSERPVINSSNGQNLREYSISDRFRKIYEQNLWRASSSISGPGSEDGQTEVLRRNFPLLLRRLGTRILLDAPCGDASWISKSATSVEYIGVDIVEPLISELQRSSAPGKINRKFLVGDIINSDLPSADTVICRDCFVHLSFDNIYKSVGNFQRTGANWLVTTTFTDLSVNPDCEDGDWRPLNFERPPFNWPRPVELLVEECSLSDGGWRDKSLGVWALKDLIRG